MKENKAVKIISKETFKKYGAIIEYPNIHKKGNKRNLWKIVHQSLTTEGWRIAYLVLRDKSLSCLQCHPNTDETFEPIKGKSVIFLSNKQDLNFIEAFWLDKPIVVFKGIWHGVVTIDEESHIKIFENNKVQSKSFKLAFRLNLENYVKRIKKV